MLIKVSVEFDVMPAFFVKNYVYFAYVVHAEQLNIN